jgi:fluoroquinolone transport system permease protein
MKIGSNIRSFIANDLKNIHRDSYFPFLLSIPLLLGILFRWLIPYLAQLLKNCNFDLSPYYPLIVSYFFVLMIPCIIGFMNGFIWIDERDDHTLNALLVTPLPLDQYLAYKALVCMVSSFVLTVIAIPLSGLSGASFINIAVVALLSSFTAPLFAIILFVFSKNKVEAFAVAKYMYVLYLVPIAAFFIHSSWDMAFGLIPTYWLLKVFWLIEENISVWSYFSVGFVYNFLLLIVLLNYYKKIAYKSVC